MLLLLDNYDSFTYNLADYLHQLGADLEVVRNDALDIDSVTKYSGIVISPGPGTPQNAGITIDVIKNSPGSLPILGVCLGMQAIAQVFGGSIKQAKYPMHGKVSELSFERSHAMFNNIIPPFEVCRYHSLIVEDLEATQLQIIAQSDQEETMAIAHKTLPLWGVQFHPEAILTVQGIKILENWLNYFNLK